VRGATARGVRWLPVALLAAGLLGACATDPLTRDEAEYPDHLVIPPDLVGEPDPAAAEPPAAEPDADEELPVDVERTIPSRLTEVDGDPRLALGMGINQAWTGTGAALNRLDFTVLERQRDELYYLIRYEPRADEEIEQPGLFARWFGGAERIDTAPQRFRIQIAREDGQVVARVLDEDGEPAAQAVAERLLTLLDRQLY